MSILAEIPAGATFYDLPAARAARAEARQADGTDTPYLKLDAGFVPVKPEFDVVVAIDMKDGNIREGLTKILVDPDDIDVLLADGLSKEDLDSIMKFVTGKTLGESQASPTPSALSGDLSRPISTASTEPVSAEPSSEPAPTVTDAANFSA